MYNNHKRAKPMSDSPLCSINGAADMLGRDRRTVERALRGVPPEDLTKGKRWRLSTIAAALNTAREGPAPQCNDEAAEAVEAASRLLAAGIERMQAAAETGGPAAAREIVVNGVGTLVGELERAMERGAAGLKPHQQDLLEIARDKIIGDVVGQICGVCQWEVVHD
jgi:hypothetical protein